MEKFRTLRADEIDCRVATVKSTGVSLLFRQTYEELKDCEKLSLEIKRYRRKRSLDANAYYWALIGKLSKVLELSNPETHNMMLCRYGQPEIFEGKAVYITIPDTEEAEKKVANATDYHLQPTSQVREGNDGIMYRTS